MKKQSIYDFKFSDLDGNECDLHPYEGEVILIINGALYSAFTEQYRALEHIYQRFRKEHFVILDFPCDDFNGQAYGDIKAVDETIRLDYQTTFPRMDKVKVTGEDMHPLFAYLTKKKKFLGFDKGHQLGPVIASKHIKEGPFWEENPSLKWNFTKFIVDRSGKPVKRFECTSDMDDVERFLEHHLDKDIYGL